MITIILINNNHNLPFMY